MNGIVWFFATMSVSCLFGWTAHKLKLPMGAMIGAMVATAAFNLITDNALFYNEVRIALQMSTGAMIGCRIGMDEAKSMKTIILPTSVMLAGMVILNLSFGAAVYRFSRLDVATALFAVTPGGASDMAMISADLGANTAYVAILQVIRIIIIITVLPPVFKSIVKKTHYGGVLSITRTDEASQTALEHEAQLSLGSKEDRSHPHDKLETEPFRYNRREIILLAGLFICSAAGGFALYILDVPAGAIIGAMLAGITYTIIFGKAVFPKKIRPWQQILAGTYIGTCIDKATVESMDELLVPVLIMLAGIIIFVFLFSYIVHKMTKLDFVTSLLACTPGGITEMSLLSEEFGADTPKIAIMQTVRLVLVIMLFPGMITVVLHFF